ncbi:MAG: membrane dipeptidase [Acidobacteriota bacterium]
MRAACSRRAVLRAAALGCGIAAAPNLAFGRCEVAGSLEPVMVSTRAVDLVLENAVVDLLGLLTLDWKKLFGWQDGRGTALFGRCDYEALSASGVRFFVPAVEAGGGANARRQVSAWLDGWQELVRRDSCFLRPIESARDLVPGRIGVLVGFQNSTHFEEVNDVDEFFRRGQRLSQLTYNARNALGSGCRVSDDLGLTPFGAEVVGRMNELGMAVDVSHCGHRTTLEAIDASREPVLATHTNCRALNPGQPRCKSDEELRAIARRGGVVGMTVVRAFVSARGRASKDDLLDHFDHAIRLVGPGHVALGTDADYQPVTRLAYSLVGLDPVARVFQITDGLLTRGHLPADVGLVLGENALRVLGAVLPNGGRAPQRDPFCELTPRRAPHGVVRATPERVSAQRWERPSPSARNSRRLPKQSEA